MTLSIPFMHHATHKVNTTMGNFKHKNNVFKKMLVMLGSKYDAHFLCEYCVCVTLHNPNLHPSRPYFVLLHHVFKSSETDMEDFKLNVKSFCVSP